MLLAIMLFFSTANIFSQETYKSLLTEGKMWKLSYSYRDSRQDVPDAYMTITVDGDSIVDGNTCKKLLVDYRSLAEAVYPKYIVAYESNGRVYRIDDNGESHLVMDMSLRKGDVFNDINVVLKEDYVVIKGIRRKLLMIDSGVDHINSEYIYYMIEGVGLSNDEFVSMGLIDENTYFHRLLACYDNGQCIFSAADLDNEGTNGLTYPKAALPAENSIYDLQGRTRRTIMKGEIFIRDGGKYIKR